MVIIKHNLRIFRVIKLKIKNFSTMIWPLHSHYPKVVVTKWTAPYMDKVHQMKISKIFHHRRIEMWLISGSHLLQYVYENYSYNLKKCSSAKNQSSDSHSRLCIHKRQNHAF